MDSSRDRSASGTARSQGGEVTVTVGPGGNLLDVVFSDKVRNVPPAELARLVLMTAQQAHEEAGRQMLDAMRPTLGNGEQMDYLKTQLPQAPRRRAPEEEQDGGYRPDAQSW